MAIPRTQSTHFVCGIPTSLAILAPLNDVQPIVIAGEYYDRGNRFPFVIAREFTTVAIPRTKYTDSVCGIPTSLAILAPLNDALDRNGGERGGFFIKIIFFDKFHKSIDKVKIV